MQSPAVTGRFVDEAGMLFYGDGKVAHRSFNLFNFCTGIQGDIFVPLDIDHLGKRIHIEQSFVGNVLSSVRHVPPD